MEAQQPATKGDVGKLSVEISTLKTDVSTLKGTVETVALDVGTLHDAVKDIKEEIEHLPTKEEFFASQDKLMVELKAVRQEQGAIVHLIRRHDDRITKLEGRTGLGSMAVA